MKLIKKAAAVLLACLFLIPQCISFAGAKPCAAAAKVSSKKQNQFTVTVTENLSYTGYQVKYTTNKAGKGGKKFLIKNGNSLTKTITNVKNNKSYYIFVRGYNKKSGKTTYTEWSKYAKVKVTSHSADKDLPDEMLDSYILSAMKYVGYHVTAQKKAASLLEDRASGPRTPMKYRSGILYGGGSNGRETVKSLKTVTGLAPDVKHFRAGGLVCASFATYYYCNYLPNIEGIDTSYILKALKKSGHPTYSCNSWYYATNYLVKKGLATVVDKVPKGKSLPAANLKKLKIGDLITFRIPNEGEELGHVAVYAGTNHEGDHFLAHVGSNEGPVFQTLERFENVVNDHDGCAYRAVYRFKNLPASKYEYKVKANKSYKYTGKKITPKLTVLNAAGKKIAAKNYTVYYSNNKDVGTAKAKVVFKGSYRGTKTVSFKIKK